MKRLIALLLSLVLCFSLCACGAKDNSVTKKMKMVMKQMKLLMWL